MSRKPSKLTESAESSNPAKAVKGKPRSQSNSAKPQGNSAKKAAGNEKSVKKRSEKIAAEKKDCAQGAEKSAKKNSPEKQQTSKTPQVMRLVEQQREVNPVFLAGKSAIPRQLRGVEPLSRIMKRESAIDEEGALVDLTAQLAAENAVLILRRFNACCCEKCAAELTRITREKLPARYVRHGAREFDEIKEQLRKAVITQMIRELLGSKRRSFHE